MSQECVDAARKLVDNFQAGNLEVAFDCVHPDGVITEPSKLWYGGKWVGPDGLREIIETMTSKLDIEVVDYAVFDSEDITTMKVEIRFRSKETGRTIEMPIVELYRERDGKLIEMDIFYKDTAAVLELADMWSPLRTAAA